MALDAAGATSKDLALLRGVLPIPVNAATLADSRGVKFALEKAKSMGLVRAGDTAVVVGSSYGSGESLNFDIVDVM
jgi:pyruvate kinase